MVKQPTDKKKNSWLARCRESDCEEVRIKCPICKHGGHVSLHVAQDQQVMIVTQHSHFVENQDAGRNMYCEWESYISPEKDEIIPSWRLSPKGRRRIIDEILELKHFK